jgi:hypothetical protein
MKREYSSASPTSSGQSSMVGAKPVVFHLIRYSNTNYSIVAATSWANQQTA